MGGYKFTETEMAYLESNIRADERAKAEQDFQNSDYWNDYLSKVLADERASVVEKLMPLAKCEKGCNSIAEQCYQCMYQKLNSIELALEELNYLVKQ